MVLLSDLKDASAAERVAVAVDEATGCARVFETVGVGVAQHLWLARRHLGMALQIVAQRRHPAWTHLHIAVQQDVEVGFHMLQGLVVPAREAQVLRVPDDPHGRVVRTKPVHGPIGGGVVRHDHLRVRAGACHHAGQEAFQPGLAVPVEDDDGSAQAHGVVGPQKWAFLRSPSQRGSL